MSSRNGNLIWVGIFDQTLYFSKYLIVCRKQFVLDYWLILFYFNRISDKRQSNG